MTTREKVSALLERRSDISHTQLAAYAGLPASTARRWYRGEQSSRPAVEEAFEAVLQRVEIGDILRADEAPVILTESRGNAKSLRRQRDFYETEAVRQVSKVLAYCAQNAVIGVVTGEYGAGKTEAVQYWQRTTVHDGDHLVFEFDEFSAKGVVDFVEALSDRLGVPYVGGIRHGGKTMRGVVARLKAEPMLLIFDQCEAVDARVFQVIRQIWDHTHEAGVGLILLASPLLMQRLHAGRMRDIGALNSRVAVWVALRGVSRAETAEILQKEGVESITPAAFDLLWRGIAGSMRRLMAVSSMLVQKHGNKPVTERTIEDVAMNLWGLNLERKSKGEIGS